ncbi:MAG: phosphotransferase [Deltaproteobacteria bacterium]|nr:phosphotransferase [Deltaproteobacteria bacterium]
MDGRLALGVRVLGAASRIAVDRVQEAFGGGLPRTPEQLVEREVLDALLHAHAPEGAEPLPPLRSARLPGVAFESSNCTNFLIEPDFEPLAPRAGATGVTASPALPRTLYAKLPCRDLATRTFANAIGFWETEVAFCRNLAHRVPIRVPKVHAVAQQGSRFVLLLENLHELEGATLFINRDMARGTTIERARRVVQTFAALHAAFWGLSEAEREPLLPRRLHPYLAPGGRETMRALNASAIDRAHRAAPALFTRSHAAIAHAAIGKWDALMDVWYAEPLTLIHGDSHLGNCFEYATPEGPRMGMLDFQGVQWCRGIRDVQYFLINSLEPELLAAHEPALIDLYVAELGARGVALDAAEARMQYRAFAFQTLMVAVVSLGVGGMVERSETVEAVLRRSVAAIDRLGFGEWLAKID